VSTSRDPGPYLLDIAQRHPVLRMEEAPLRQAIQAALAAEGIPTAEVSLVLTDDAEIQRLNREFLGHDYPTDVISFSLSDDETSLSSIPLAPASGERARERGSGGPSAPRELQEMELQGELIVSLDTAGRVAAEEGWSLTAEVLLYVVHGLLHLCGHDDQSEPARSMMRKREREILALLALPEVGRLTAAGWEESSS
jgi:probable rRNA maturation factor